MDPKCGQWLKTCVAWMKRSIWPTRWLWDTENHKAGTLRGYRRWGWRDASRHERQTTDKPHFYMSRKAAACDGTSRQGERRMEQIIRTRGWDRKRERPVPGTAAGPDSLPVLITIHGCPNNTPWFLRWFEGRCFLQMKDPELKQRESSAQRPRWRTRGPQCFLEPAFMPEMDLPKIASWAWSML